ncbi:MAG: thiamine-phosphate kinase [Thermoleophilia bacterium]
MLVAELGEEALLIKMRDLFEVPASTVAIGIGDDAAVIEPPASKSQEVWTTDLMAEGIHFQTAWQTARELGRKSLAVNLSDIASMGASPRYALFSLACHPKTRVDYVMGICDGIKELASETGVAVIGGDTSASGESLIISITMGGVVPEGEATLRNGARIGDRICVTGYIGCAAAGLRVVEVGASETWPQLREAFVSPKARINAGMAAREAGVTAMTDLSDGLASDLKHICDQSQVGAVVAFEDLLIHPELRQASAGNSWDLEELVLTGGEDYELLFTLPPARHDELSRAIEETAGVPVTEIGEIVSKSAGLHIMGTDGSSRHFPAHGYEHFAGNG